MGREGTVALLVVAVTTLLIPQGALADTPGSADTSATERRLLRASVGLQMPGSEADSDWWFVSYPGEEGVPTAARMASLTGCTDEMTLSDFDETFERLGRIEPWMDRGQRKSARGFRRLGRLFDREYEDLATYRCETGGPEVPIFFVGADENGLSGLKTVNIET